MPNLPTSLFGPRPSPGDLLAEAHSILSDPHRITDIHTEPDPVFDRMPLPTPKYFLDGERLWTPQPMPASMDSRTLVGEVAQLLGRCVNERYEWDRPIPIKTDGIAALLNSPALKGQSPLEWELQADAQGTGVLLLVRAGGRPLESTEVLDLRKIPAGMVVLTVDPKLETVRDAISTRFNGEGHTEGALSLPMHLKHHASHPRPLHGLPQNMRIMVLGHGGRVGVLPWLLGRPYAADRVGGMSAGQLADRLVKQGLEKSHSGTLYLENCDSAAGFANGSSFAQALQSELSRRGYRHVAVAGLPGVTYPDHNGHNYSFVSQFANDHHLALKQSNLRLAQLQAQMAARQALARSGKPVPIAHRQVMPHATLPSLDKAVRREKAHGQALHRLARLDVLERKKVVTDADAHAKRHFVTGVREWWGHFGARGGPQSPQQPQQQPAQASWFSRQWGSLFGRR